MVIPLTSSGVQPNSLERTKHAFAKGACTSSATGNFSGSTSNSLTQTVTRAGTSTSLTTASSTSAFNSSVTFTATVKPQYAGTPTGTATFVDTTTGATLGTQTLAGGTASLSASTQLVAPVSADDEELADPGVVRTTDHALDHRGPLDRDQRLQLALRSQPSALPGRDDNALHWATSFRVLVRMKLSVI